MMTSFVYSEPKTTHLWKGKIEEFNTEFNISLIEPPEGICLDCMIHVEVTLPDSTTNSFEVLYKKAVLTKLIASGQDSLIQEIKNAYLSGEMYHKQSSYDESLH